MSPTSASGSSTDEPTSVPLPPRPKPDPPSSILDLRDDGPDSGSEPEGPSSDGDPGRSGPLPELSDQHRLEWDEPIIWAWRRIVGAAFAFLAVVTGWYVVKLPDGLVDDWLLPGPGSVAGAFGELFSEGFAGADLVGHLRATLLRFGLGVGTGAVVGGALGWSMVIGRHVRTVVDPITSFFRSVPAIAIAPLFLFWFGNDEATIAAVVAFAVVWPIADHVAAVRDRRARGAVGDSLYEAVSAVRSMLLLAWVAVLVMETVLATVGLGSLIWFAQARPEIMVAVIITVGLTGLTVDIGVRLVHYVLEQAAAEDRRGRPEETSPVSG